MQIGLLITDTEDDVTVEIGSVPNGCTDTPEVSNAMVLGSILMDVTDAMNGPHYEEVGRLLLHITANLKGDDHGSTGHPGRIH